MLTPGGAYQYVVMQNGATATGNGTAIVTVTGSDGAYSLLDMQVTGITTATITFEATVDGTNWVAVGAATGADWTTVATTAAADGIYRIVIGGLCQVRARISAYTTGTITVTGVAAAG